MQPKSPNENWQQPPEQPAGAPYQPVNQPTSSSMGTPVVTMSAAEPTASEVPLPPSPAPEQPIGDDPDQNAISAPSTPESEAAKASDEPVYWQAKEYIHHERNALWFVIFTVIVLGLMAIAIFLMDSISFAILVPVMAAALLVYIHRPPRELDYTLSKQGLHINDHLYPFADFKGFGVIHDGSEYSVMLIPIKRFKPGVSVYFPEEAGEAIVDMLGARLPMEELRLDLVDHVIRKLRI